MKHTEQDQPIHVDADREDVRAHYLKAAVNHEHCGCALCGWLDNEPDSAFDWKEEA